MTPLQQAAQAVIDRWDSPLWKDDAPTAVVIGALLKALYDERAQAVAAPVPMSGHEISKWWGSENGLEDCDMCIHGDFEKVVRAVEAHYGIEAKLVTKPDSRPTAPQP